MLADCAMQVFSMPTFSPPLTLDLVFFLLLLLCFVWVKKKKDKWSKTVAEQEQEARKEENNATNADGSKETLSTSDMLHQTLSKKTSGYLEKMSKAILPSKLTDTTTATLSSTDLTTTATTEQNAKRLDNSDGSSSPEEEYHVQRLPRVFHPLN